MPPLKSTNHGRATGGESVTTFQIVSDPGNAGTITPPAGADFRCNCVTGGVESRVLGTPKFIGQLGFILLASGSTGPITTIANNDGFYDDGVASNNASLSTAGTSAIMIQAVGTTNGDDWRIISKNDAVVS